ncbi:MAG: formate dehydrogenase [delta proteobacterium ML8_F1]|nr:MAG: formate dehydrogenase [delta proteobacterium ML8_F1]
MTNSIREVIHNEVIFVIGSNTTENHPVIGAMMRQAVKNGAKLIVADPRRIPLARDADIYLPIQPGTNVALLNGMIKTILEEKLYDEEFIRERTVDFNRMAEALKDCSVAKSAALCQVSEEDIRRAARLYASSHKSGIYYAMGITQHSRGTEGVYNIANLAMMTGNVGVEFAGVNPLRGQSNVQGSCDLGGLPDVYPGYQKVADEKAKARFEASWGVQGLSREPGLTLPKMVDKALEGKIKMIYIMGENPMVSDPDLTHFEAALDNLDFLVVQDIFMTETAQKADVVLPAAAFAEKDGTFTNTERRIQRIRKALDPPGEAKADWWIINELMKRMGYQNAFANPEEIMAEIAGVTPIYGGIDYERIDSKGLQWPVKDKSHPGTPYLHRDRFTRGLGQFMPVTYTESAETADEAYPLILTTGRLLYHYHTRSMTGRIPGLNEVVGESYVEICPKTAALYGLENGEWVTVRSRRGEIKIKVKITEDIKEDVVFIPFHFADAAVNRLTNVALDPIADIPELKVAAVRIEKLA